MMKLQLPGASVIVRAPSMTLLRVWLAVAVLALAVYLGGFPLIDSDEGRNAEVAREMAETNDYVVPRYNGLPYLDKPVLYFAAGAAVMEVLGTNEVAARLPSYLFTLATAAIVFLFARRVWGTKTAWIAAIIHLAIPLTVAFSRVVIFDSALTFFTTTALVAFYFATDLRLLRWSLVAWAALGLAMITKGPVAFLLVLPAALFIGWRRSAVRLVFPISGLLLFAAIVAPWVWGMSQVVPEFLRYVLVTETVARMATDELQRTGPPWYFVPYMLAGAMPWSIALLVSWKQLRTRENALLYWLLAIAVPLIFFSISQSKRPQYVLPLMPALALVVARIWDDLRTRGAAIVLTAFGVILLIAPFFRHRFRMRPEILAAVEDVAFAFGAAFVAGGIGALIAKRRDLALVALSIPALALPICANPMMLAIAERRSAKEVALELRPHVSRQTEVIGVEAFTGSLAFYLERPITIVTEDASELTSNYLVRRSEKFIGASSSTLEPLSYFPSSLAATHPRVYVIRIRDTARRTLLESRGWRVIADGAHVVAYGR